MIEQRARAIFIKHEQVAQEHAEVEEPLRQLFARQLLHRCAARKDILHGELRPLAQEFRRIVAELQAVIFIERQRPAEAAVRQRRELRCRALGDAALHERPRELRLGDAAKAHMHAARKNRIEKRRFRPRHEDEVHGARRFFERLQKAVFRRLIHRLSIIDDHHVLFR